MYGRGSACAGLAAPQGHKGAKESWGQHSARRRAEAAKSTALRLGSPSGLVQVVVSGMRRRSGFSRSSTPRRRRTPDTTERTCS